MRSTLSERIAKNQLNKNASDHSRNKVSFIALKDDIATALLDGWSQKSIWETLLMENKISFSYKTFCVYVARFITVSHTSYAQDKLKEDKQDKTKANSEIRGFVFNPKPNLKELL